MLKSIKFTKILSLTLFLGLVASSLLILNARAAESQTNDKADFQTSLNNKYLAGGNLEVTQDSPKDLVIAGGTISITSSVQRNLIAAGGTVDIKGPVGASVRATGGTVKLESNVSEDVIIAAGEVIIKNSTINGDLIVTSGKLTIENSKIKGDFYGSYGEVSGDISSQVAGKQNIQKIEENKRDVSAEFLSNLNLYGQFSVIIVALVIYWIQKKRDWVEIDNIKFNGQFGWDFLIGSVTLIVPSIVIIISGLLSLIPFVGYLSLFPFISTLSGWIYLTSILSLVFVPIYLANLLRNSFNKKISVLNWLFISFGIIFFLRLFVVLVPVLFILELPITIVGTSVFGYILRNLYSKYLTKETESE
jgi:hypothetical protein